MLLALGGASVRLSKTPNLYSASTISRIGVPDLLHNAWSDYRLAWTTRAAWFHLRVQVSLSEMLAKENDNTYRVEVLTLLGSRGIAIHLVMTRGDCHTVTLEGHTRTTFVTAEGG